MNIKNLFLGACAVAAFTACSSSDDLAAVQQQPTWNQFGNGYVAFSVAMPTDNSASRANDSFDKGSAWEYGVKDVALLIFKGENEANAVYEQFVSIDDVDFGEPANNNITLDKKYVKEITGMDKLPTEKFYGLAVINRNKVFVHSGSNLTIGGHTITIGSTKFSDIQGWIMDTNINANGTGTGAAAGLHTQDGGILMLNAPLYDQAGNGTSDIAAGTLNILQDITTSIFPTENEAREGACANIYVERAVAKVSVKYDEKTGSNEAFDWDISAWRLDNTNTKSFIVRNMSNFAETYNLTSYASNTVHRMVGSASTAHQAGISMGDADRQPRYRTYFAIDPNYNTPGIYNVSTERHTSFGTDFGVYCAENVFDVDHQIWGETTRVIVSAVLTPKGGDSYYAHPGDDKYLSTATVKELAYNYAIGEYRKAIKAYRDANLLSGSIVYADAEVTINGTKDEISVTLPTNNITVASTITDADVEAAHLENGITRLAELEADLATINHHFGNSMVYASNLGVNHYNGGISYYQVRIKHFGDDDTPWNLDEYSGTSNAPSAGGVDAAYPDGTDSRRDANYLGRYGVLRNNWYVVNLTNVVKIGYATLEQLALDGSGKIDPETPDDHIDKEAWINAEVNILSWAKRFQNNNLGED